MEEFNDSEESYMLSKPPGTDVMLEDKANLLENSNEAMTEHKLLNLKEASFVMLGITLGSGVLIMPFVIRQLGIIGWIVSLLIIVTINCFSSTLLARSTEKVLDESGRKSLLRDPYQLMAERSSGKIMRMVSTGFIYLSLLTCCISLTLLCASILTNLITVPGITETDCMRLWSTILVVVLTPITYLGTYSELRLPALLAVTTAVSSACLIVVNSFLYKFLLAKPGDFGNDKVEKANQIFFIPLGTILFSTGGSYSAANITSMTASPSKIHKSFIVAFSVYFIVLIMAGIVPYMVFGDFLLPNTVSTFYRVINDSQHQDDNAVFPAITVVIDVLMLMHMCTAIVLVMNPLFLHLEEIADVADKLCWKRVGIRTATMVFCLTVCLILPRFAPMVSLTGGIPYGFVGIIIPIVTYIKLFPPATYIKVVAYIFILGVLALVVGNFGAVLQQMFNSK